MTPDDPAVRDDRARARFSIKRLEGSSGSVALAQAARVDREATPDINEDEASGDMFMVVALWVPAHHSSHLPVFAFVVLVPWPGPARPPARRRPPLIETNSPFHD